MERKISSAEKRVRDAFALILHQVDQALDDDVRESFPLYAHSVDATIDECQILLDEAFIYNHDDYDKQAYWLDCCANRIALLEMQIKEPPVPGESLGLNKHVLDVSFRTIKTQLLQSYEVYFPKDDELMPPESMAR